MWLPYCRIRPLGYFGLRLSYESRRRDIFACHSVNTYFSTCKPYIVVWGFWHACMEELSQILNLNFAQLSIGAATFPGSLIWCMFSIRVCLCISFYNFVHTRMGLKIWCSLGNVVWSTTHQSYRESLQRKTEEKEPVHFHWFFYDIVTACNFSSDGYVYSHWECAEVSAVY